MSLTPTLRTLPSGWLHFRINSQMWAQLPPGWGADEIPVEYAFDPGWSLGILNREWRKFQRARLTAEVTP